MKNTQNKSMYELLKPEVKHKLLSLYETSIDDVKAQYFRAIKDLKFKKHITHLEINTGMKLKNIVSSDYNEFIFDLILLFNDGE